MMQINSQMKRDIDLGGSQVQELLSSWSWGVSPCWCGYVHPPGRSLNSILWEFLWHWVQGWKFQGSNDGLVFLVTSSHPIQEPIQSHLIRTKDALVLLPLRIYKPCIRDGVKDQTLEQEMF